MLKSLYYSEAPGGKAVALKPYWTETAKKLYDVSFSRTFNSYEGVFLQNLFLKNGDVLSARNALESPYFCFAVHDRLVAKGCAANQLAILCATDEKLFTYGNAVDLSEDEAEYVAEYCRKVKASLKESE
jgi:hypothetical protein